MEQQRLASLHELAIFDTAAEPEFDDIVRLAAAICGVPIGVFSLINEDRQWAKAAIGLQITEIPRSIAFCDHTIRQKDLLLVEDARKDERFASNPMVTGDGGVRFYAGFPVTSPDGHAVGSLCVADQQPRYLDEDQKITLRILAGQVSSRLELRLKRHQLEQALREKDQALQEKEHERALAAATQRRFQQFMNSGPFMSYMRDADGRMLYYNQPLATRFNVTMDEMLGKTNEELWPAEDAAIYRRNDQAVLDSGKLQVLQETSKNADGTWSSWRSYKFPCMDEHGNKLLGGVSIEITEELRKQEELEKLHHELQQANVLLHQVASIDALTGLSVRRVFDEELRLRFREAKLAGDSLSVLLLDIDNFKSHNDQYGHPHGDRVLQALGTCLRESLRPSDMVARYGGEEFVVLFGKEDPSTLARIVGRVLENIRALSVDGTSLTASAGLCSSTREMNNAKDLVDNADVALLAAKRAGKDRFIVFDHWSQTSPREPFYSEPAAPQNGLSIARYR